ncbi:MAG: PaaI family thioesterase [Granulosicoccaceae bacterium]
MIPFTGEPSGVQKYLQYQIFWQPGEGRARCVLPLKPDVLNRGGALHGGIAVTLLDAACGIACESAIADPNCTELSKQGVVTVDFYTQFVSTCHEGEVVAEAEVTRCGQSIIYVRGDLRTESGKLLTTGTGTFKRIRQRAVLP